MGKSEGCTDIRTRLFMYLSQSASIQEGREMAFSVRLVRVVDGRLVCQKRYISDFVILICHYIQMWVFNLNYFPLVYIYAFSKKYQGRYESSKLTINEQILNKTDATALLSSPAVQ